MELDHGVLFFLVEMAGTVAFAVSGAMLAVQRGLDLFGVVFLGAATAIGGGVLRDLLLGQVPPLAFLNGIYLLVSAAASLAVFATALVNRRRGRGDLPAYSELLNVFDAAGLGIFSVIGVQHTVAAGFGENLFFCVFLGMTTGVGGGMLRDVLSHSTPAVLRKHVYALASLAARCAIICCRTCSPPPPSRSASCWSSCCGCWPAATAGPCRASSPLTPDRQGAR